MLNYIKICQNFLKINFSSFILQVSSYIFQGSFCNFHSPEIFQTIVTSMWKKIDLKKLYFLSFFSPQNFFFSFYFFFSEKKLNSSNKGTFHMSYVHVKKLNLKIIKSFFSPQKFILFLKKNCSFFYYSFFLRKILGRKKLKKIIFFFLQKKKKLIIFSEKKIFHGEKK